MEESEIASKLTQRFQAAKNITVAWSGLWRELARYVKPDRDCIGVNKTWMASPNAGLFDLFDGTAMSGNLAYAAGCMAYMTPADEPWFRFEPPKPLSDNETVKEWTSIVTETVQEVLARSNFYSQIHEGWLEDGAFGTCSLFVEEGDGKIPLRFVSREIGDYSILENNKGEIDSWFHEISLTHRQAAQEFGEENLSDDVQDALREGGAKSDEKRTYLHAIYPRTDAERDRLKIDGENMPIASVYMDTSSKKILRKSGYWESPEATGRYMRWGRGPYGIPPFLYALADQRQLNDLQKNMDVLAEVAAFPRIQAHTEQEGEIDLRSNGITWFKDPNHKAMEWLTGGRYDIGIDRVKERQEAVRKAFHVDLFQMFGGIPPGKQMTATEVIERKRDKLTLFHPTFARKTSELLTPLLQRVFALMLRNGFFPPVPNELLTPVGNGMAEVIDPEVTYTSRIALELKAIQTGGFQRAISSFAPLASMKPEIFDHVDFDAAFRDTLRNEGVPEAWIADPDKVEQLRQARLEAQQAQAQKEEMAAGVETAATAAKAGLIDAAA